MQEMLCLAGSSDHDPWNVT